MGTQIPKRGFALVFLVLIILVVAGIAVFWISKQGINLPVSLPSLSSLKEGKQWANCSDVRKIIEEGDNLYAACLGGVLVVDTTTGRVIDQITMTQGLSKSTTTDLVKKGNILYIGTQDGFTIFDLKSRQAKKISVKEGLISGANIILEEDGDDLWVGTFEGLSRYNTKTGQITNFTTELVDNSSKYNATKVLVTPNAVYVVVVANVSTSGGVARYDKTTKTWERFGPGAFGVTGQYARVDFFALESVGSKVFVSDNYKALWATDDKLGATWQDLSSVVAQAKNENEAIKLVKVNSKIGILSKGTLSTYDASSGKVDLLYPNFTEGSNVLADGGIIQGGAGSKLWVRPNSGPESDKKIWLEWLDLNDLKTGSLNIVGRPIDMGRVVAVVDSKPIIDTFSGVFEYNPKTDEFKNIPALSGVEIGAFRPMANSSKVFIFSQSCGMGCPEPKFVIFDYKERSVKPLEITDELMDKIKDGLGYRQMNLESFDAETGAAKFSIGYAGSGLALGTLDASVNKWTFESMEAAEAALPGPQFCNPNYSFESSGGKFGKLQCGEDGLVSDRYKWLEISGTKDGNYTDSKIEQENKKTGEKLVLDIPGTPSGYSPFPDSKDPVLVNGMTYAEGLLWVGTTRGLSSYNPETKKWKTLSTKDGLIDNGISNFVVDGKIVWAATTWTLGGSSNGFSGIVY